MGNLFATTVTKAQDSLEDTKKRLIPDFAGGIKEGITIIKDSVGNVFTIIKDAESGLIEFLRNGELIILDTERNIMGALNNVIGIGYEVSRDLTNLALSTETNALKTIDNGFTNIILLARKTETDMVSTFQTGMVIIFSTGFILILLMGNKAAEIIKEFARSSGNSISLVSVRTG